MTLKHKNNTNTLSKSEVNKINKRYIRGVDKFRRMFVGLSSNLKKYEDGIIYIAIENMEKIKLSNFKTVEGVVESWIDCNGELKQAKGWVVFAYKTNASTGFIISNSDLENQDVIKKAINEIKVEKDLQLVNIFSGILTELNRN